MVETIISNVVKELRKKNYRLYFDGAYDWVLTPSQKWFKLYENGEENLIFIYDDFGDFKIFSDDVYDIVEFIEEN